MRTLSYHVTIDFDTPFMITGDKLKGKSDRLCRDMSPITMTYEARYQSEPTDNHNHFGNIVPPCFQVNLDSPPEFTEHLGEILTGKTLNWKPVKFYIDSMETQTMCLTYKKFTTDSICIESEDATDVIIEPADFDGDELRLHLEVPHYDGRKNTVYTVYITNITLKGDKERGIVSSRSILIEETLPNGNFTIFSFPDLGDDQLEIVECVDQ